MKVAEYEQINYEYDEGTGVIQSRIVKYRNMLIAQNYKKNFVNRLAFQTHV